MLGSSIGMTRPPCILPEDIHGSRGTIWEACHRMHRLHVANNSDRALNHYAAEWYVGINIIHSHSLPQVFHDSGGCSGCLASRNMKRAHELDAVRRQKFWFRKHILPDDTDDFMAKQCPGQQPLNAEAKASQFEEMTMDEIMNGKSCYFPGLVPLCSWSNPLVLLVRGLPERCFLLSAVKDSTRGHSNPPYSILSS